MAIIVTGAAGFIGSCMLSFLNQQGRNDIIIVDDFSKEEKWPNLEGKQYIKKVDRKDFLREGINEEIDVIFHMGARTDTTEFDQGIFDELNLNYSKSIWNMCVNYNIPLIYASSAATYGEGEVGFDDDPTKMDQLKPLNPYGLSKLQFDLWAVAQDETPPFWSGLKFFNVFGPNEYHKGRMASVVLHAYKQIQENGRLKLFQSHREDYADGEQERDFIYVIDLLKLMWFWYQNQGESGIYNAGTGKAETFLNLAHAIFMSLDKEVAIDFIPTPEDIRDKYQYYTQANMNKTLDSGYNQGFYSLEDAVKDYVVNYLVPHKYY
ncbi:MAG: ADP-glyceromanno-heptose 6-epimerase [Bacteroidia bacterium]